MVGDGKAWRAVGDDDRRRPVADAPRPAGAGWCRHRLDRGRAGLEPTEEEVRHAPPENPGPHRPTRGLGAELLGV
jgi:hypothetical protein